MTSKLTASLESELRDKDADELIDIIMELAPAEATTSVDKREKVAALKAAFDRVSQPIVEAVQQLGGEVTGRGWINRTLRARVPAKALGLLSTSDAIESVDAPHKLQAEYSPGPSVEAEERDESFALHIGVSRSKLLAGGNEQVSDIVRGSCRVMLHQQRGQP